MILSKERKTVAVDKELAEKLSEVAKKEGKTIFSFINDLIKSAIDSSEIKESFVDVLDMHKSFNLARDVGFTLTPLKLENHALSLVFEDEGKKEKLIDQWYNWGSWLGNYVKARFPGEEFEYIIKISKTIFISGEVFEFENSGNAVTIRIYGNVMGEERTTLIAKAFEGIFHEFGYKTDIKDVSRGICRLKLKK